jgi:hypothetical protein
VLEAIEDALRPTCAGSLGLDPSGLQRVQHPAVAQHGERLIEAVVQLVGVSEQFLLPVMHGVQYFATQAIGRYRRYQTAGIC